MLEIEQKQKKTRNRTSSKTSKKTKKEYEINKIDVERIIRCEHNDPFSVLGMHYLKIDDAKCIVVRAFIPSSKEVFVLNVNNNERYIMNKIHDDGFYEVVLKDYSEIFMYKLDITYTDNNTQTIIDPYSFWPILTEYDLYLFNEGNNHRIYEKMGAHLRIINGIKGVHFAVWAPTAKRVSVIGNFNYWDGRRYQMRSLGSSGVWEIFIPDLDQGEVYKYEIKTHKGEIYQKADPYAFYAELKPRTASIVYNIENYTWHDKNWIETRSQGDNTKKPISIYEVHLGSWKKPIATDEDSYYNYRELAHMLVSYAKEMSYTHIELLPITEHPFDGSWGYQVTGYYAPTSRYGTPEDFMYFVDYCHQNDIGVIMDWVPAHYPKDGHGLARFDGSALYEHQDKKQGEHLGWGTHVFNFGRNEVRNFLVSNAIYWCEKYHIDGLRVDAVASMIYLDYCKEQGQWIANKWGGRENLEALEFIKQMNIAVHGYFPGVMVMAEESTSWPLVTRPTYIGGLGFSFKWNMGWMNDFLKYMSMDPIYRKYNHNNITFTMMYNYSENFVLVLSHDEVVHGKCSMLNKMPGDYWQKFANLRTAYGFMYGHPGKKLLFMGGEFGQFIEWDHHKELDWFLLNYEMHNKMRTYVKDINRLYKENSALWELDCDPMGFQWLDCNDSERSLVSFARQDSQGNMLVFVCNFTPVVYKNYKIGVPHKGFYREILNSDSEIYGGSNAGNNGGVYSKEEWCHGREQSIDIVVPPLATVIFKWEK